jgi:TPP-dependent pyruvate/acetoin dehydrogenase alpha subunit
MDNSPDWLEVAHTVLLSRKLDLLEVDRLTPQGKIKYQFSAAGHELAQVLLARALTHPHDAATVYYRSGHFCLLAVDTCRVTAGMGRRNLTRGVIQCNVELSRRWKGLHCYF